MDDNIIPQQEPQPENINPQQPVPPVLNGNVTFNPNLINRNIAGNNAAVDVRDRLFHVLFYRLSIMYARSCSKSYRRVFEFFALLTVCNRELDS